MLNRCRRYVYILYLDLKSGCNSMATVSELTYARRINSVREMESPRFQRGFDNAMIVILEFKSGCNSMAECKLPKLEAWVRFPSPAPVFQKGFILS